MKKKCKFLLWSTYTILFMILTYGKRISIKNEDFSEDFKLDEIINNNQHEDELIIYFGDPVYDMSLLWFNININIINKVTFLGNENGTIFNYNYTKRGCFFISINSVDSNKGELFTLENIIFKNYSVGGVATDGVQIMFVRGYSDKFQFLVKNCTFTENEYKLFRIDVRCSVNKNDNNAPFVLFDHCNFINNKHRITYAHNENHVPDAFTVKFQDCYFNNNRGLFYSYSYMIYEYERCYFSTIDMDTDELTLGAFFSTLKGTDKLIISNSVFENINIQRHFPFIEGVSITIEINNSTFTDCYSEFGHLFEIKNNVKNGNYINISDSVFESTSGIFTGVSRESNAYIISNSLFNNITLLNAIPAISDIKYTHFQISDSNFNNIDINKPLFNEETSLKLINVNFNNIKSNSNPIIYIHFNDLDISNTNFEGINCMGSNGDTSLIVFDSGEKRQKLSLNNVNINDGIANDSLIKIKGNQNDINIENININNIVSYGSIIENSSRNSKAVISNSNFTKNVNNNKLNCGNIHFSHNLDLSVSNSKFINNISKSNGGAICLDNINSMELNLMSNTFDGNSGSNGGALYLEDIPSNENKGLNIENNIFNRNIAENFGGAIYSNFNHLDINNAKNNKITFNKAGIDGGGVFIKDYYYKNIINKESYYLESNYNNDFSTKPSYITMNTTLQKESDYYIANIYSGDYLPLKFTLFDGYDNILKDVTKYYSSITLKVILESEDNLNNSNNNSNNSKDLNIKSKDMILLGNIGSFINGRCDLNNFKIYAIPSIYYLKVVIENYDDEIKLNIPIIKVKINNCGENQIKMYDRNNMLYCENPECEDNCPINVSAYCKPFYEERKNDKSKNMCICLPGWKGPNCENKIYIDYVNIKKLNMIIVAPSVVIILVYLLFIKWHREQGIIKNTGYLKIVLLSTGLIIYLLSFLFSTYTELYECILNFILKHIGVSLIVLISYIYITQSYILGIKVVRKNNKYNNFITSNPLLNFEKEFNKKQNGISKSNENLNKNKNSDKASTINTNSEVKFSKNFSLLGSDNVNTVIFVKEKEAYSSLVEAIVVFIGYIIVIFSICIYNILKYSNKLDLVQNQDYWVYQCKLDNTDFFINLITFIFLIILFLRGRKAIVNENIFICVKYITYATFVIISLGPLINIAGYFALREERYERITFESILNFIGYMILFIFYSWDKIYYIIKNRGNEMDIYFKLSAEEFTDNKEDFMKIYENCNRIKRK
ncbi:hypothetical protein BCR36DRAFT_410804 [Piromyces finnis]|uniref:EGF-like domain-containing protein n=1 Tax=Piromyces finnis TaxID=1754191 RepID=A0A1Y1VGE4_9FUNG|nr:hypothetical protein BCR36DRAFT_410804 [Piromyces finnis]|eukprot:ORX54261.1 hypothetical protein BCR36DRAFT_410804 [Piromyces finnis]